MSDDLFGLREGLEVAASGELTLDREKAREKLRMFRLPDPHYYVLQFVRAASLLGAPTIHFELGPGEMQCRFDAVLPPEALEDFWEAGFRSRRSTTDIAVFNIAQGVGAAQVLNPGKITVTSDARRITFIDQMEHVEEVAPTGRTTILVRERLRFSHVFDYFKQSEEQRALQEYCQFSQVKVFVNGAPLSQPDGFHPTPLVGQPGMMMLANNSDVIEVHILRDDVRVHRLRRKVDRLGAVGWVNSRTLQTDLTGLRLVAPNEVLPQLLPPVLAAYHATLLQWVMRGANDRETLHYIGIIVLRQLQELKEMGATEILKPSLELFNWWKEQSLFSDNDTETHPLSHFVRDGVISYTQRRIPIRVPEHIGPVMILRNDRRELPDLLKVVGIDTIDVQRQLQSYAIRQRNEELFNEQEVEELVIPPIHYRFEHGSGTVAYICIPDPDNPAHEQGGLLYKDGRLLKRNLMVNPISVIVEGTFELDFETLDFTHDWDYRRFARRLIEAVPNFFDLLGRAYEQSESRQLRELLGVLIANAMQPGRFERDLLGAIGMTGSEQQELFPSDFEMRDVRSLRAAADANIYLMLPSTFVSLNDIVSWEEPPIVMANNINNLNNPQLAQGRILRLLPRDGAMISTLRPTVQAAEVVERNYMRQQFLAKPQFMPQTDDALVSETIVASDGSWSAVVLLLGVGASIDLQIVAEGRLVTMRSLPSSVGQLRVVVAGRWTLNERYTDVVDDDRYQSMVLDVHARAAEITAKYAESVCSQRSIGHAALEYVWWRARSMSDHEMIPAYVFEQGDWRAVAVTTGHARRHVEATGHLVRVTRQDPFDGYADTNVMVMRVPFSAVDYTKMFPNARLVSVDGEDGASLSRYEQRPLFERARWRVSLSWTLTAGGFQHEGLLNLNSRENVHVIHIVWRDRELEKITMDSAIGTCQTVITGPSVKPDATYAYLLEGRREVMAAAQQGAERLVLAHCERLIQSPNLDAAPVRNWLLRVLRNREQVPQLRDQLMKTPLFPAPGQQFVSFQQLLELAVHGVVSWSDRRNDPRAMLFLPAQVDRNAAESVLAGDLTLMPIDEFANKFENIAPTTYHADELLNGIASTLVQARGERRELFDDALATGLRWADDVDGVCRVDARGVILAARHPLVLRVKKEGPQSIAARFLASVIYTEINARYRGIVDEHEVVLQTGLLGNTLAYLPTEKATLSS